MPTVTRRTSKLITAAILALPATSALAVDHIWQSWYGINGTWSHANAWDASGGHLQ